MRVRGESIQIRYYLDKQEFTETLRDIPITQEGLQIAAGIRRKRIRAMRSGLDPSLADWGTECPADMDAAYLRAFTAARLRGREYTITPEEQGRLIARAGGKCEVTGIPFHLDRGENKRAPFAPSLDRINSAEPYHTINVRLVCVAANIAMNEWGEGVLRRLALGYLKHVIIPEQETNAGYSPVRMTGAKS